MVEVAYEIADANDVHPAVHAYTPEMRDALWAYATGKALGTVIIVREYQYEESTDELVEAFDRLDRFFLEPCLDQRALLDLLLRGAVEDDRTDCAQRDDSGGHQCGACWWCEASAYLNQPVFASGV